MPVPEDAGAVVPGRVPPPQLQMASVACGEGVTLVVTGELDMVTWAELKAAVVLLCRTPATGLVIDLSGVEFMDSSGVRAILSARGLCESNGMTFGLVRGPPQVQRIFEIVGLHETLPFVDA